MGPGSSGDTVPSLQAPAASPPRSRRRRLPRLLIVLGVVVVLFAASAVTIVVERDTSQPSVGVGVQTHSIKEANAFSALIGRPVNRVEVYMNDTSWTQLETPWFVDSKTPDEYWPGWVKAEPGRKLIVSQGMAPDDPPANWRANGAAGDYDAHFTAFATNLVADGLGNSIIRLGWEMNYDQFAGHYTGTSAKDVADWKAYFVRIVKAIRAVPGGHFLIDWNPNSAGSTSNLPFNSFYPGDASVDIIGLDIYDNSYGVPGRTVEQRWAAQYGGRNGLGQFQSFARIHNKPMSFGEWALVAVNPKNQNFGAGDNPFYIDRMADFIKANDFAYESYFNSTEGGVGMTLADAPNSVAVFKKRFGHPGDAITR